MSKENKAKKFDGHKLRLDLVPPLAILAIARALTYGVKKYSANNWRYGLPFSRLSSALERHWFKWKSGEDYDAESGLHHLDSVITTLAMIIEQISTRPDMDDRYDTKVRWDLQDNFYVKKEKKNSKGKK